MVRIALILITGFLLFLNVKQIFGRIRTIDNQCSHGDCTKREYPWIEALYRKQQDPFLLLNTVEHRRLFNQPYYEYFINLKSNNNPRETESQLMENYKKSSDNDMLKTYQYLQDHTSDIPQSWQEHDNILNDINNNNVIFDKNNIIDMPEDSVVNGSVSKRMYHHRNHQNDYDSFLAMAKLGNISLENLKHTRSQSIQADEKFTSVESAGCSCSYDKEVLDLGNQYSPRYHMIYKCATNSCLPPYTCKGKYYKIWVLKKREEGDPVGERYINMLPEPFKKLYLFVERSIPVACECLI